MGDKSRQIKDPKLEVFLETSLSDNDISDDQSSIESGAPVKLPMHLRNASPYLNKNIDTTQKQIGAAQIKMKNHLEHRTPSESEVSFSIESSK